MSIIYFCGCGTIISVDVEAYRCGRDRSFIHHQFCSTFLEMHQSPMKGK